MPRIAPALFAGVLAGLVIGPIAYVVVARHALSSSIDAASPAPARRAHRTGARAPDPAPALTDSWFGRIVDATICFGPSATAEYFVLARPARDASRPAHDADTEAVAVVAIRRLERGGMILLEREVVFEQSAVRVLHTERIEGGTRRLVWREFLPSGTRSWMAEWSVDEDRVQTIGYGWHRDVHEWIDGAVGMAGPLEILDAMRVARGGDTATSFVMIDPTSACVSDVIARTVESVAGTERTVEVRRADESLVLDATIVLEDDSGGIEPVLTRLRFGEGRIVATPVSENDFRRRQARWKTDIVPAHVSLLARIPKRH